MFVSHVASSLSCAGAEMPVRPVVHRYQWNATHGTFVLTTTVRSSGVVTLAMLPNTKPSSTPLRQASMFWATAAEFSGLPSWNVMPGRSVIVHSSYVEFGSTLLARYGWISPLLLGSVSVS